MSDTLDKLDIRATAVVEGAITNRVRMKRVRKPRPPKVLKRDLPRPQHMGRKRVVKASAPRPVTPPKPVQVVAYRQDKSVRGVDFKVICISVPTETLARIDEAATKLGMCRSEFLRVAALGLAAFGKPESKP